MTKHIFAGALAYLAIVVLTQARDPEPKDYFDGIPPRTYKSAEARSIREKKPILAVVHEKAMQLDYELRYWTQRQSTRDVIDEHFIPCLLKRRDFERQSGIEIQTTDKDGIQKRAEPLESPLVFLIFDGKILHKNGLHANPDSGKAAVLDLKEKWEKAARKMLPKPLLNWTSKDGRKTIAAKFLKFDGQSLELEDEDGKNVIIAVENLSEESVKLAETWADLPDESSSGQKNP